MGNLQMVSRMLSFPKLQNMTGKDRIEFVTTGVNTTNDMCRGESARAKAG